MPHVKLSLDAVMRHPHESPFVQLGKFANPLSSQRYNLNIIIQTKRRQPLDTIIINMRRNCILKYKVNKK